MRTLLNHWHHSEDKWLYLTIVALTLARVLTSKILPCLPDFDCNAYIKMTNSIAYDPTILAHHAMRIFPSLMAKCLMYLGSDLVNAFRILSGSMYILFGVLCYWVLRKFSVKPLLAFAFTLLCLAPYHAMRIPLQNVYQLCDIMTYPLSILMVYFSIKAQSRWVFVFALLGLLTKQTVFGLGFLSLVYCFYQRRRFEDLIFAGIVVATYLLLQHYYQATGMITNHLTPSEDFFSLSHIAWVIKDSKLLELFVPILPFLIIYFKPILISLFRYWHIGIYIGVTVGQPFIGYHLTGNNFARLALQGVWLLFLISGILSSQSRWPKNLPQVFVVYAMMVYFSWGMTQRYMYLALFSLIALALLIRDEMTKEKVLTA